MTKTKVLIVIPTLNEEKKIKANSLKIERYLEEHLTPNYDWKLCISDNGSTDNTLEIVEELIKKSKNLIVVKVKKKGVGIALKTAFEEHKADIIGYMDLDMATPLKFIPKTLDLIKNDNIDLVYGSRLHKDSKIFNRTLKRSLISKIFNFLIRTYFRSRISDSMCGFKFMKASIYPSLLKNGAVSDGWFFCAEFLIIAEHLKYKIKELPVEWHDDADSKVKVVSLSLEYLNAMQALKKKLNEKN